MADSVHPETQDVKLSVSEPERRDFSFRQGNELPREKSRGNQGIARRRLGTRLRVVYAAQAKPQIDTARAENR
ncbi:MAG: hypothetical protein C0399_08470 [Syntrophus sp. (in: bacteria)]|nr:hypothetical protein [Syntrophus sp. (in: bacteria)]